MNKNKEVLDVGLNNQNKKHIDNGYFFAWDVLAAISLIDSSFVATRMGRIHVSTDGSNAGRTELTQWYDQSWE